MHRRRSLHLSARGFAVRRRDPAELRQRRLARPDALQGRYRSLQQRCLRPIPAARRGALHARRAGRRRDLAAAPPPPFYEPSCVFARLLYDRRYSMNLERPLVSAKRRQLFGAGVVLLAAVVGSVVAVRASAAGIPTPNSLTYTGYLETPQGEPLND